MKRACWMDAIRDEIIGRPDAKLDVDHDAIIADIASLKRDLSALTGHIKSGADGAARNVIGQLSDKAVRFCDKVEAQNKRAETAVRRRVDEQPVIRLLIAFVLVLPGSRLLSRRTS